MSCGFGTVMRLVALKYRFKVAFFLSRKLKRLIKLTTAYKEQIDYRLDDIDSISLAFFLSAMTKAGTLFEPVYTVRGIEKLRSVLSANAGTLMVGVHGQLHGVLVRHLVDSGYTPIVIHAEEKYPVAGTKKKIRAIVPDRHMLLGAQSILKAGHLLMALIDLKKELKGRSIEMQTPAGPVYIATPIFRVASYCNANLLFFRISTMKNEIVISIDSPSSANEATDESYALEFINFLNTNQN